MIDVESQNISHLSARSDGRANKAPKSKVYKLWTETSAYSVPFLAHVRYIFSKFLFFGSSSSEKGTRFKCKQCSLCISCPDSAYNKYVKYLYGWELTPIILRWFGNDRIICVCLFIVLHSKLLSHNSSGSTWAVRKPHTPPRVPILELMEPI